LAVYRALLQPLFPGKAIRCALLWTETPKLMEIEESALDAALTALGNLKVTGPH
jgi:ATP-dependent helicase/nuclease subunit A